MDKLEKAERLKKLLTQIAPGKRGRVHTDTSRSALGSGIGEHGSHARYDAAVGAEQAGGGPARRSYVDGDVRLEAIILPKTRPVVFVKDGTYDNVGRTLAQPQRGRGQGADQSSFAADRARGVTAISGHSLCGNRIHRGERTDCDQPARLPSCSPKDWG